MLTVAFYRPGVKTSAVNKLIYAVKQNADDTAARILAQMMSREIMHYFTAARKDASGWIVSYPPRQKKSKRRYGFDQAQRLARFCAEYIGSSSVSLFRRNGGKEQKRLGFADRQANIENAFYLKDPALCHEKRIILCDDVFTSGATLFRCAFLLSQAGAQEILLVTAAKTMRSDRYRIEQKETAWYNE